MDKSLTSVGHYQAELLADIFSFSAAPEKQGLQVYQHNLQMTAQRSLQVTFPVLAQMIGEEAIFILASRLLQKERPASGDWADWGHGLINLLRNSELYEEHPYLVDMATFEWAFHQSSRSQFSTVQTGSLQRLGEAHPDTLYIYLQPSLAVIRSDYPLYGLWQLHRNNHTGQAISTHMLEAIMHTQESGCYVTSQTANYTQVSSVSDAEMLWLEGILQGLSVGALLDTYPGIDFAHWLSTALQNEWIVKIDS